jgi:phage-related protein
MRDWWSFSQSTGQVFACHIHAPLETVCLNYVRVADRALVGRYIVFLQGKKVVVLHAFIKKSQQTPDNELKMARKRLKEVMHG